MHDVNKFRASRLMVERAEEQIETLSQNLTELRPFRYIHETDANTGRSSLFAERDEE